MTIRLNGSISGYTEIDAPANAGSNTLLLPTGAGSAYQVMRNGATAGSLEFTDKIVSETAKAWNWNGLTTNTSIDFTGIPSWVKRVTVMLDGVSTNGTSAYQVQLGSGSIDATGYTSRAYGVTTNTLSSTTGILLNDGATAASVFYVPLQLVLIGSNTWLANGQSLDSNAPTMYRLVGRKALSGTLDRVRMTTVNGADTFDAGSINILYE